VIYVFPTKTACISKNSDCQSIPGRAHCTRLTGRGFQDYFVVSSTAVESALVESTQHLVESTEVESAVVASVEVLPLLQAVKVTARIAITAKINFFIVLFFWFVYED